MTTTMTVLDSSAGIVIRNHRSRSVSEIPRRVRLRQVIQHIGRTSWPTDRCVSLYPGRSLNRYGRASWVASALIQRGGTKECTMTNAVEPQPVLTPLTGAAIFLVLSVPDGAEDDVRGLLPDIAGLSRTVGVRVPDGGLRCVLGIGSQLWDRLFGGPRPAGLHPFREIAGPRHTAVSTPGDLLLHIRANRMDLCFELAGLLVTRLSGRAEVVDEVHGFMYFDERDLLGFVDGTENPTGAAATAAALVGDEQPEFAGGSYVIVQKYLHDLESWNTLSVEEKDSA